MSQLPLEEDHVDTFGYIDSGHYSIIKDNLDADLFMNSIATYGKQLDAAEWRMLKGRLVSRAFARASNNLFTYVGDDTSFGFDLRGEGEMKGINLEHKHRRSAIWTAGMSLPERPYEVRFINKMTSKQDTNFCPKDKVREKNFTYLLITSDLGAGLLTKEYCMEHVVPNDDSLIIRYKPSDLKILCGPDKGTVVPGINAKKEFNYAIERMEAQIRLETDELRKGSV